MTNTEGVLFAPFFLLFADILIYEIYRRLNNPKQEVYWGLLLLN